MTNHHRAKRDQSGSGFRRRFFVLDRVAERNRDPVLISEGEDDGLLWSTVTAKRGEQSVSSADGKAKGTWEFRVANFRAVAIHTLVTMCAHR